MDIEQKKQYIAYRDAILQKLKNVSLLELIEKHKNVAKRPYKDLAEVEELASFEEFQRELGGIVLRSCVVLYIQSELGESGGKSVELIQNLAELGEENEYIYNYVYSKYSTSLQKFMLLLKDTADEQESLEVLKSTLIIRITKYLMQSKITNSYITNAVEKIDGSTLTSLLDGNINDITDYEQLKLEFTNFINQLNKSYTVLCLIDELIKSYSKKYLVEELEFFYMSKPLTQERDYIKNMLSEIENNIKDFGILNNVKKSTKFIMDQLNKLINVKKEVEELSDYEREELNIELLSGVYVEIFFWPSHT